MTTTTNNCTRIKNYAIMSRQDLIKRKKNAHTILLLFSILGIGLTLYFIYIQNYFLIGTVFGFTALFDEQIKIIKKVNRALMDKL